MSDEYPQEVLERIEFLNIYKESDELNKFDIFHLYPKELAYPNGYTDSKFFELIGFNTDMREKRLLGKHDAIDCLDDCKVKIIQIYADGAYLIKFNHFVETVGNTQMIVIKPCGE